MIIWRNDEVSDKEKKNIKDFISKFSTNNLDEFSNLPKPNAEGSFSNIYFLGDFALKHTPLWDYDFIFDEELDIDLVLQSDHEVLMDLKDLSSAVDFYGYSEDGFWVILRRVRDLSLEDSLKKGIDLSPVTETKVIEFISHCIDLGWYPVDLRFRDIFTRGNFEIKIIDYNLFQEINYLKEMDAKVSFEKSSLELAIDYWKKLKEIELKIINDYLSILSVAQ